MRSRASSPFVSCRNTRTSNRPSSSEASGATGSPGPMKGPLATATRSAFVSIVRSPSSSMRIDGGSIADRGHDGPDDRPVVALVHLGQLPRRGGMHADRGGLVEDAVADLPDVDRPHVAVGQDPRRLLEVARQAQHPRDVHDAAQRQDPQRGAGAEQLPPDQPDRPVATGRDDHVVAAVDGSLAASAASCSEPGSISSSPRPWRGSRSSSILRDARFVGRPPLRPEVGFQRTRIRRSSVLGRSEIIRARGGT